MEKTYLLSVIILSAILTTFVSGQTQQSPLERYLETGKTIVVAKCLSVGPVNILLRANVRVQILFVVKGKETERDITVESQFGMKPGEMYLLRTENEAVTDKPYFQVNSVDSAVRIWPGEDLEKLKTLSPRIIILRTMNMRVNDLESEIRSRTYELDALKIARREN